MQTLFECLMVTAFCMAAAAQLVRYVKYGARATGGDRLMLVTMGIGFVIGAVNAICSAPGWEVVFYAMGAMLSYMAVLYSNINQEKGKGSGVSA